MISEIIVKIVDLLVKNLDGLYQFVSTGINYDVVVKQLKSLSFVLSYLAEAIKTLGMIYV